MHLALSIYVLKWNTQHIQQKIAILNSSLQLNAKIINNNI